MPTNHEARRARTERSLEAQRLAMKHVARMRPKHKMEMALALLEDVLDGGVTYAEFEAAKAAESYIRTARNALRGLG